MAQRASDVRLGQIEADSRPELIVVTRSLTQSDVDYFKLSGRFIRGPRNLQPSGPFGGVLGQDFDADGQSELAVFRRPGLPVTLYDASTGDVEWTPQGGVLGFDIGDVDTDGDFELTVARGGPLDYTLFDPESRQSQSFSVLQPISGHDLRGVAVTQTDVDGQLEACLVGRPDLSLLRCFDSSTQQEDLELPQSASGTRGLGVVSADVLGGPDEELIVAEDTSFGSVVHAVDPVTGLIQWSSDPVAADLRVLEADDLDGDGKAEGLVGLQSGLYVLEGATGAAQSQTAVDSFLSLTAMDVTHDGLPEILLGNQSGELIIVDASTLLETSRFEVATRSLDSLARIELGGASYLVVATEGEILLLENGEFPAVSVADLGGALGRGDSMKIDRSGSTETLWVGVGTSIYELSLPSLLFRDGLESSDLSAWSSSVP